VNDLYPFQSNFLQTPAGRLHYLDEGPGSPRIPDGKADAVVMLHGNPTWSFYYRNVVLALRKNYRCIVPDHIGCGLSDKPDDSAYAYTLSQRVDDLAALLDRLGVNQNITLIVHDWGGMIGMAYAHRFPERIKRLVILNTGGFHLPKSKPFPTLLWIARNTPFGEFLIRRFNMFAWLASRIGTKRQPLPRDVRRMLVSPYNSYANRIATIRFVQDIPLKPGDRAYDLVTEVDQNLSQFAALPKLICFGLKDFVFDRHFCDEWERRFPDAQVHRFADCGHYILEDAKDEVIPLIEKFLRENPIPAGTPK